MTKKETNKKVNPLLWFLFAIIIPITVVLVLIFIILNIAGFDTFQWLKDKGSNLPVISNVISSEEQMDIQSVEEQYQMLIEEKDQEIDSLIENLNEQAGIIQDLEIDINRLENQEVSQEMEKESVEDVTSKIKKIAKSYQEMDPTRAALILQNMSDRSISVSILDVLANDSRGEILQEMEPEIAADLTEKLMAKDQ